MDILSRASISLYADESLAANDRATFDDNGLTISSPTGEWAIEFSEGNISFFTGENKEIANIGVEFQADESNFSNVRLRTTDGIGELGLIANSRGHVSLKELIDKEV